MMGLEWDIPSCEMLVAFEDNPNDGSGNSRNFTANGTITYAAGRYAKGAQFAASGNNFFSQAYAPNPESGSWTFGFWAKFDNFTVNPYFFEIYYGASSPRKRLLLYATTEGIVKCVWGGNSVDGPTLSSGVWYKLDVTVTGSTAYFYVNGSYYGSVTPGATAEYWDAGIYLGSTKVSTAVPMRGMVDGFYILSSQRSAAAIKRRYAFEKGMLV